MFCKYCGTELDNDVIVCTNCGKQVQELKTTSSLDTLVKDKNAWYYEWWFIVLMFIFFFPIGIVLLILKLNNDKAN